MAEERYDELVRDLTTLGRVIEPSVPAERVATAVIDRVAALPPPEPTYRSRITRSRPVRRILAGVASRRRRLAIVVAAVLLALLAAPPVRAAVSDWFGYAGVLVQRDTEPPGSTPAPPPVVGDGSLSDAADAVDFTVSVPTELGPPEGVEVSADRRIVSMTWSSDREGVVRLDQFDGRLDFTVAKTAPDVEYASVAGTDALWFEAPHEVALLDPDGSRRTESARLAGHTLIWPDGDTTLRLEGALSRERAVEIAESAVPMP